VSLTRQQNDATSRMMIDAQVDTEDYSNGKKARLVVIDQTVTETSKMMNGAQVDTEDYSNEVCTLQTAAQSFTKVDGQLVRLFLNSPVALLPEKVMMGQCATWGLVAMVTIWCDLPTSRRSCASPTCQPAASLVNWLLTGLGQPQRNSARLSVSQ